MDAIVKDAGITERYYFLESSLNDETYGEYCLFGQPKSIENLLKEYEIPIARNPKDDYN